MIRIKQIKNDNIFFIIYPFKFGLKCLSLHFILLGTDSISSLTPYRNEISITFQHIQIHSFWIEFKIYCERFLKIHDRLQELTNAIFGSSKIAVAYDYDWMNPFRIELAAKRQRPLRISDCLMVLAKVIVGCTEFVIGYGDVRMPSLWIKL